ncbi:putative monooxygenase [Pyrenochaeta sp. MPI-SDFR-AT-0127]|nr:putative monooxygenase [Pyrenochaeta sp. MPI-SDFR-AT-0127]
MHVTIVGAGLGGLSCAIACRRQGFSVLVVDQVPEFLRIGDSIGFGSNSARLLYRWGVGTELEKIASSVQDIKIYNFDSSDTILGIDDQIGTSEAKYGCRQLIGHRGDFHLILYQFAILQGVQIRMGTTVSDYNASKPSVLLESGEEITSDVVIIADGVKSKGRKIVLGYEDKPFHSGYAVYRSFVDTELVKDDPLIAKFIEGGDSVRLFLAPDMHGFISTLRNGEEINAVLTHKDTTDIEESWTKSGTNEDVLALLDGWDPAFKRVWEKMPTIIDWKLVYRPCLDKWVSDSGLVALMGDAAHPFLPTSTQGASQAIEDGATIAKCLARCEGNVPLAMKTYFEIRHDYVAKAQATGIKQRDTWHNLHSKGSMSFKESFDINAVAQSNLYLWANDAEKVVDDRWEEVSKAFAT